MFKTLARFERPGHLLGILVADARKGNFEIYRNSDYTKAMLRGSKILKKSV